MTIHIQWDPTYSVGHLLLDRQHQKLLGLSNALEECAAAGQQVAQTHFHDILHELAQYAREHFHSEEELMHRSAYPDLERHKLEHAAFEQQIADWAFAATMDSVDIRVVQHYIAQWWRDHILGFDMQYKGQLDKARKQA
jgi:hemerythrin-like metal-binding protein